MPQVFPPLYSAALGVTDFVSCFELQQELRQKRIAQKIPNLVLFTEHPPTFTLGRREPWEDFLTDPKQLLKEGFSIVQTNRGGKITYHGPGQLVVYWIVSLREFKLKIGDFVALLEDILLKALLEIGIPAVRNAEYPGVWVKNRKIAALGLHVDRGVTTHGFSLNIHPDLGHYQHIIPCGILDHSVTSIAEESGKHWSTTTITHLILEKIEQKMGKAVRTYRL